MSAYDNPQKMEKSYLEKLPKEGKSLRIFGSWLDCVKEE